MPRTSIDADHPDPTAFVVHHLHHLRHDLPHSVDRESNTANIKDVNLIVVQFQLLLLRSGGEGKGDGASPYVLANRTISDRIGSRNRPAPGPAQSPANCD